MIARVRKSIDEKDKGRHRWWESPGLLGAGALSIGAILTIVFV